MFLLPALAEAAPLAGVRLKTALARPSNRSWTEFPLRGVIDQLGIDHRVAIFLDRRVDPGQKTSLDALRTPLGKTLDQLADMVNTKTVQFGSIVYIGPEKTAKLLPVLSAARRDEVRTMSDRGRAMLTSKAMSWNDLATPRELIEEISEETGVAIGPIESIPHDLWAGAELPNATPVDRLTLILAQFDKTFKLSKDAIGKPKLLIVDIPESVEASVASQTGHTGVETAGPRVNRNGNRRPTPGQGTQNASNDLTRLRVKRFAVKQKPVGVVIDYLARQWNLQLDLDRAALDEKLKQRINVTKENVTVPELIRAVLGPAGLEGNLDPRSRVLRIRAR